MFVSFFLSNTQIYRIKNAWEEKQKKVKMFFRHGIFHGVAFGRYKCYLCSGFYINISVFFAQNVSFFFNFLKSACNISTSKIQKGKKQKNIFFHHWWYTTEKWRGTVCESSWLKAPHYFKLTINHAKPHKCMPQAKRICFLSSLVDAKWRLHSSNL